MSVDILHEKIRKLKSPLIVDLSLNPESIPPVVLDQTNDLLTAYGCFCRELMEKLRGVVPGVRFSFSSFALYGPAGLELLMQLLKDASKAGFYTLLDAPSTSTPVIAAQAANCLLGAETQFPSDGVVVDPYFGSDAIKPFISFCKEFKKTLVVTVRSANKSASELQDLITGSRLVHGAAADLVARYGENLYGKCGYSHVVSLVSATSPESIRNLRLKYKYMFLLVDGIDYPSGNAKNCSLAFDRFGYGAVVCVGASVTAAWKENEAEDYGTAAVQAAERICKNLLRYITIL